MKPEEYNEMISILQRLELEQARSVEISQSINRHQRVDLALELGILFVGILIGIWLGSNLKAL